MNPDSISLDKLCKIFEYEKLSREIDGCESIDTLRTIAKAYVKLYLKTQETILQISEI